MSKWAEKKAKREKYSIIYNEYYPLIFNTVYTRIGNRDDASDICQEIFLIFFEKLEEIQNYRKWLFGTMRNVVIRFYEKKPDPEIDIDNVFNDISLTFVNGFRDTRIIIGDAIDSIDISEEDRILFEYIAYYNYSYNNVVRIMGLTKKQVRLRYEKAVRKILGSLREKGIHNIEDLL